MQNILIQLKMLNGAVNSEIIKDLIDSNAALSAKMHKNYLKYKGDVPIITRTFPDITKINNKLANDYRGDIIDNVVGYLFGKPITYQLDAEDYNDTQAKIIQDNLYDFNIRNNIDDMDSETGKKACICGYGARLLYIDTEGQERVMNIDPWECIFIEDGSTDQPQYAFRYYPYSFKQNNQEIKTTKVEWYDNQNISYFIEVNGSYIPDTKTESLPVVPHLFGGIPLIKFKNNDEEMSDFEKVESLIDSYDRLVSDVQNEVEEFRLAYMLFYGVVPDAETIQAARQTGAFGLPAREEGAGVEFLTKDIGSEFIENHKKTLNDNIYKFSKTVDMQSENFSGSSESGESRKWKLLGLENKSISKERKFSAAIRQMFKVLTTAWAKKGIVVNYLDLYWDFKRNIPIEISLEAETTLKLKGLVSEQTRLGLLSFVDDTQWEIGKMQEETSVNLDNVEDDEEDGLNTEV